ncbi:alpha/beta fold hydrolase [Longirhabdus pacifica]|uniref:alpha/beta fold hydrolase n=1 Tax=Longirhabdus pacifica TaxID=2305227 RepID=UPI001009177D|nr:alpha/beta hydrolase [Longirhabdus pacifica]
MKCSLGDTQVYYEIHGTGKPIIMIHGFTPDHRLMMGCMEPIFKHKTEFKRIYIDLPGMGKTSGYDHLQNADDMLQIVLDFIDEIIGDASFMIVGQSYGGYIARGVIAHKKEQVEGAAFLCPVIIPDGEKRTLPHHVVFERDETFLEQLSKEERTDFESMCVILNEQVWHRYHDEILTGIDIADHRFLEKIRENYAFSFDVDKQIDMFHRPTLFITGKQDAVTGYEDVFHILPHFPHATFTVLDVGGHNLHLEQASLLESLIDEWLQRVQPSKEMRIT